MATLRSNFNQSDSELRAVLNLEGDLADVSIEGTLRIMVDSLKDSREEFRIFEEGDGWIHELEERMVNARDPLLRRELLKSADLIRVVRSLSEIALIEMAEEGASDEDRRNCDESPEVKAARDAQRREAILKLITESMDESSKGSATAGDAEAGPVSFDYGISVDGDSSFILSASEDEISSDSWLQDNLREDSGDLIVARSADGESDWEPLSAESMGKIAELIEDDGCGEGEPGSLEIPELYLEDEPDWSDEIDQWLSEIVEELTAVDCPDKRKMLTRRASLLKSLSEAAWRYEDLSS